MRIPRGSVHCKQTLSGLAGLAMSAVCIETASKNLTSSRSQPGTNVSDDTLVLNLV
jgi:hypothetical protein